jgi:hypothetical protein
VKRLFGRALPVIVGIVAGAFVMLIAVSLTGGGFLRALPGFGILSGGGDHQRNQELVSRAYEVIEEIRSGDFEALARSAHPEHGVIFSPYATISLTSNKCFFSSQIAVFETDANTYVWGVYGDGGDPIELTPAEYFSRFVYNRDYARSPVIGVNHTVRVGNALENLTEILPDVKYVDFHFPGDDKNSDSTSWNSLRLGFEEYEGELLLTLILHSEWT